MPIPSPTTPPASWDAKKLATRYGLNVQTDFYIEGSGRVVILKSIIDSVPIFDLQDPPGPTIAQQIDGALLLSDLKTVLKNILTKHFGSY